MTENTNEPTRPRAPVPVRRKRGFGMPLVVIVLVAAGLIMVVKSSTAGGVYDMTIGELNEKRDQYLGKEVRVNGVVLAGSVKDPAGEKIDITFTIGDAEGNRIRVSYHQLLPDAFKEGRQVIVQGVLDAVDHVTCQRLTVKCPSKYKDENKTDDDSWKTYDPTRHEAAPAPAVR